MRLIQQREKGIRIELQCARDRDGVAGSVFTDGEENSSREFQRDTVFRLIEERQRDAGYEFVYLGANQDSYIAGQEMGIRAGRMIDYEATGEDLAAQKAAYVKREKK